MSISVERDCRRTGATALATSLLLLVAGPVAAKATFTTFDVNGASATYARGINTDGAVTGYYKDFSGNYYGFFRAPDGAIVTFDAEGTSFTVPLSINSKGAVAGRCNNGSGDQGFVRSARGKIQIIDIPDQQTLRCLASTM
jgi:hypothetical protein